MGNLTLSIYNKNVSNKGFDDKKTYYKKSKWRTERELTKIDEWSIDAINQREKEMIAFAINRWSTHNI